MRWFRQFGRVVLAGSLALVACLPIAFASNSAPSGWDVAIDGYTRGPNYCDFTLTLPPGATGVNTYMYMSTSDSSPYNVQRNLVTVDSNDDPVTVILYNMRGGGYDTYMKMTYDDANGNESPLPDYFFILQMDVAVYLDGISSDTLAKLQTALANLEDSAGVGAATSQGTSLQNALTGAGSNLDAPGGNGLYSVINFGSNQWWNGQADFMSSGQLAKFPWLQTLRQVAIAVMWILFVMYLVRRFAPLFKV